MADYINVREGMAAIMRKAGLHPALIHAHLKTGMIVGEDTPVTPAQRQEWIDAVNEWYDQNDPEVAND